MSGSLVDGRLGVEQAICLIESFVKGDGICSPPLRPRWPWPDDDVSRVREEIARLQNSPQAQAISAQAKMVWDLAIRQKKATVWFLRSYRPATMLIFQMCKIAVIPCERLLAGHFVVRDFPVLTGSAARLATAPLKLCDARPKGAFVNAVATLVKAGGPCRAVCDWVLEDDELLAARRASREAQILFTGLG